MRIRRSAPAKPEARRAFTPGDLVLEYARRLNWPMKIHNLMVEGTLDVEYFSLANSLYRREYGLDLMGTDFSVFAVGERDKGGTIAIQAKLVALREVIRADPCDGDGNRFRVICLADNDTAGQRLRHVLTSKDVGFIENRDIFLLRRRFPITTRDPVQYTRLVQDLNRDSGEMACELEDLLSRGLLEVFTEENPDSLHRRPFVNGDAHHYEFHDHAKPKLLRFAKRCAILQDVSLICDVLKAMRYAMGLPLQGHCVG